MLAHGCEEDGHASALVLPVKSPTYFGRKLKRKRAGQKIRYKGQGYSRVLPRCGEDGCLLERGHFGWCYAGEGEQSPTRRSPLQP